MPFTMIAVLFTSALYAKTPDHVLQSLLPDHGLTLGPSWDEPARDELRRALERVAERRGERPVDLMEEGLIRRLRLTRGSREAVLYLRNRVRGEEVIHLTVPRDADAAELAALLLDVVPPRSMPAAVPRTSWCAKLLGRIVGR